MADDDAENNLATKKTLTQFICISLYSELDSRKYWSRLAEANSPQHLQFAIKLNIVLQTLFQILIKAQMTGHYS